MYTSTSYFGSNEAIDGECRWSGIRQLCDALGALSRCPILPPFDATLAI
jgi:hypothetical protein